jgi:hypothetical protein
MTTPFHPRSLTADPDASLATFTIRLLTEPDDLVLDPTCSNDATLIAAAVNGRRAIGVTSDPQRAAAIRHRLHRHIHGGQPRPTVRTSRRLKPAVPRHWHHQVALAYLDLTSPPDTRRNRPSEHRRTVPPDRSPALPALLRDCRRVLRPTGVVAVALRQPSTEDLTSICDAAYGAGLNFYFHIVHHRSGCDALVYQHQSAS